MQKLTTLIALLLCFSISSFSQNCYTGPNNIIPHTGNPAGLSPNSANIPCSSVGSLVEDTIYFTNFTSFNGVTVDSLTIDSIGNLPAGTCWSTNKTSNTFAGGESGVIYVHGLTTAAPGQYSMAMYITGYLAGGITVGPNANWNALAGLYYWLRVTCPGVSCTPVDTVNGKTHAYIAYSACVAISATIAAGGPTTFCTGDSVLLTSTVTPSGSYTYQWYNGSTSIGGATSASYYAKSAGSYHVVATSGGSGTSNSITVSIGTPGISITPSGPTTFCQGGSVTLQATSGGSSYLWSNGQTTPSITVSLGNTYTVTVSNPGGCPVSPTSSVTVTVNALPIVTITPGGSTTICQGTAVTLTSSSASSYHWNTGSSSQFIQASATSTYYVTVTDANGCTGSSSIIVTVNNVPSAPAICIVSVDSATGKNLVVWQKTGTIDSFDLYAESSIAGVYQQIRSQPYADFSTYLDVSSNPAQQSSTYVLTSIDQCGASSYSVSHTTIHLTSNLGVGGVVNLIWNAYQGFTYTSFNIYRGTSPSNMQLLNTVASNILSYTDLTPPTGTLYYQIEVVNPGGCVPSKTQSASYNSSLSNVINVNATGINEINSDGLHVYYHSNGSSQGVIRFSQEITEPTEIMLYDMSGRLVMKQSNWEGMYIPVANEITNGIYIITVKNNTTAISAKLSLIK